MTRAPVSPFDPTVAISLNTASYTYRDTKLQEFWHERKYKCWAECTKETMPEELDFPIPMLRDAVALWIDQGTVAHSRNLTVKLDLDGKKTPPVR